MADRINFRALHVEEAVVFVGMVISLTEKAHSFGVLPITVLSTTMAVVITTAEEDSLHYYGAT